MPQNDFLPFCPVSTGTNLLSEADYLAATDRTSGNQPGIASSKLNNKALRQANAVASQLAQLISDQLVNDVLDNGTSAQLLSQMKAALLDLPQVTTPYLSGSGTHFLTQVFFIASGSATVGATYSNNGQVFTVKSTISGATLLFTVGTGAPSVSGTLTKTGGVGDATLSFFAVKSPKQLEVLLVGGGGGGGGQSAGAGNGGDTTFGSSFLTAGGGSGGDAAAGSDSAGGPGGVVSVVGTAIGIQLNGSHGMSAGTILAGPGGIGGVSALGGAGSGGTAGIGGSPGVANSGSGGGGSGGTGGSSAAGGGGAGAYISVTILQPNLSYAYSIGAGGAAGTGSPAGAVGGSGYLLIKEIF